MQRKTIDDLFIHALSDIYSAEKQLTKALPKMARAASNTMLQQAFLNHLEETNGQVERIDQIVEMGNLKLKRIKCAAMEGLVEEGAEVIDEIQKGAVLDAALIGAAQKVEHYEIASYGTLVEMAKQLGMTQIAKLLAATLQEEKDTDVKLTKLAGSGVNEEALQTAKSKKPATAES